ncbi:MAG: FtsQ-type POTRA domain-containing protein [Oscillospiraceae bacterium]|nr:FtsQ-type POTRA domain-containing protein [Oscillospiraceae bacterium]
MKDVEKTSIKRENSIKRMRRRKRENNRYAIIVLVLFIGIGITMLFTFLLSIQKINVYVESDIYTKDEVLKAFNAKYGDNMIRFDAEKEKENLLEKLIYAEDIEIKLKYPSTIDVNIYECEPKFNVKYEFGTMIISGKGKILENSVIKENDLPIIYGYEPSVTQCGKFIDTVDEHKKEVFEEIISVLNEHNGNNIISVDMNNKMNVIINFKDGNVFKMGSWNDFEYKLNLAETVIEKTGKKGYITMIGTNQCSFRTTDGSFSSSVIGTEPVVVQTGTSTETTTADSDNPDSEYEWDISESSEDSENSENSGSSESDNFSNDDNASDYDYGLENE